MGVELELKLRRAKEEIEKRTYIELKVYGDWRWIALDRFTRQGRPFSERMTTANVRRKYKKELSIAYMFASHNAIQWRLVIRITLKL